MTLTPIMTMLMITEKNSLQLLYSLFTSGAPTKYAWAAIWLVRATYYSIRKHSYFYDKKITKKYDPSP